MLLILQKYITNRALRLLLEISASLIIMIALTLLVYFLNIPNPNMILITGLIVSTAFFGIFAGVSAGLEMILYSWFFFSTDHIIFSTNFTEINAQKLLVIIIGVVITVAVVGSLTISITHLFKKLHDANEELRLDNEELAHLSEYDPLTGTRNRFAFRKDYDTYIGQEAIVMLIDIDDFKSVNDIHGHDRGDLALKRLASKLQQTFGVQQCFRYGGDEFIVLEKGNDVASFEAKLNSISFKEDEGNEDIAPFPIHFSAGYVYGKVAEKEDLRLMIAAADQKLYDAKRAGKDCFLGEAFIPKKK